MGISRYWTNVSLEDREVLSIWDVSKGGRRCRRLHLPLCLSSRWNRGVFCVGLDLGGCRRREGGEREGVRE